MKLVVVIITDLTCTNSLMILNTVTMTMTVVAIIGPVSFGLAAGST